MSYTKTMWEVRPVSCWPGGRPPIAKPGQLGKKKALGTYKEKK